MKLERVNDPELEKQLRDEIFFPGPKLYNFRLGDVIGRSIWNQIHIRPQSEHLHEFLYNLLLWTVEKEWFDQQIKLPLAERHVIMRWAYARYLFMTKALEEGVEVGQLIQPSGEVRELISLASDLYYLQLTNKLPSTLINRLKDYNEFQGARYEIAVAASLVRTGFEIEWVDKPKDVKKHEFDARHKYTGEVIAIEVKSRRRRGTLHESGSQAGFNEIKLDIFKLYNKAMKQNPLNKSFGVFIDINLPLQLQDENKKSWKDFLLDKLQNTERGIFDAPSPSFLAITNNAWHYDGQDQAKKSEFYILQAPPSLCNFPINNHLTFEAIAKSLHKFSEIPTETFV